MRLPTASARSFAQEPVATSSNPVVPAFERSTDRGAGQLVGDELRQHQQSRRSLKLGPVVGGELEESC